MKKTIDVVFANDVADDIIAEFPVRALSQAFRVSFEVKKKEDDIANFTGDLIAQVALYIKGHQAEILTSGLLFPIAYDLLKATIKRLWERLYLADDDASRTAKTYLSVHVQNDNRDVDIVFEGSPDQHELNKLIDAAFAFLRSPELDKAFANPDFIAEPLSKPRIRIAFDESTNAWLPVNFTALKENPNPLIDDADKFFDS